MTTGTDDEGTDRTSTAHRLILLGVLVMIVSYFLHGQSIGYDGVQYLEFATNLLKTATFTYDGSTPSAGRTPGYPALLAGIIAITGSWNLIYPLQFACLWVTYWCIGCAFSDVLGRTQRALFITLMALTIPLHRLAAYVVTEPTFLALTAAGLLAFIRAVSSNRTRWLLLSAILIGLSSYVRPVNILLPPFLALIFIVTRRLAWKPAVLYVVVSLVVLAPWTIRNAVQFGRFIPMASHIGSFYYMTDAEAFWPILFHSAGYSHQLPIHDELVGNDLELDVAANERYLERGLENVYKDPFGFLGRCVFKTIFVWSYLPGSKGTLFSAPWLFGIGVLVQWLFLILSVLGLRRIRRRAPVLADTITAYALYTALLLFPMYAESRFLLPVYVWLAGCAYYFAYQRREWLFQRLPHGVRSRLTTSLNE